MRLLSGLLTLAVHCCLHHTSCPLHKHPRHKTESPVCSLIVPLLLQWLLICHVQSTPHLTEQPQPTPSMTCHSLTLLCLNTFWLHSPSLDGESSIPTLSTLPRHASRPPLVAATGSVSPYLLYHLYLCCLYLRIQLSSHQIVA